MRTVAGHVAAILERADAGGWCLLGSGLAVIALTVLLPTWFQVRDARYQRDAAQRIVTSMQAEQANYEQFAQAIQQNDPLLLQRLAWHQLHLKPAGFQTLDDATPAEPGQTMHFEQWLRTPPPVVATPPAPLNVRLVRLTTTRTPRFGMLALGGLLIAGGLLTSLRSSPHDESSPSTTAV